MNHSVVKTHPTPEYLTHCYLENADISHNSFAYVFLMERSFCNLINISEGKHMIKRKAVFVQVNDLGLIIH